MDTPTTQPTMLSPWPDVLPPWLSLLLGFLLLGIASSTVTTQLRAALPEHWGDKWRALHYLYPSLIGAAFATGAPFALPGFDVWSRWLPGLVAPYLWAPLYELLKRRYESQLGVSLPSANQLTNTNNPQGGTNGIPR